MPAQGKGPLRIAVENWWSDINLSTIVSNWLRSVALSMRKGVLSLGAQIGSATGTGVKVPTWITDTPDPESPGDAIILLIMTILGVIGVMLQLVGISARPYALEFQRIQDKGTQVERPDPATLIQMARRDPNLSSTVDDYLAESGYNASMLEGLHILDQQQLAAQYYFEAWARGSLDQLTLIADLIKLGFSSTDIEILQSTFPNLPQLAQAIEIAQRGGSSGGLAGKYGLDDGMTDEYLATMKKLHYDASTAQAIWRGTRTLPNYQQVAEMMFRLRPGRSDNVTTQDDLEFVLQASGIPAYFRSRLIEIASTPLPRLIIQGMYRANTLDAAGVLEAVKDLGYTGDRAQAVADYLTREVKSTHTDLSRSAIIDAYSSGIYSHDETYNALIQIGDTSDDANFYISLADYNVNKAITSIKLQIIQAKYVNGNIDDVGLANELGALNLPAERATVLQELWTVQRNNKTALPTRSELDGFLTLGIIDITTYQSQLALLGYDDTSISWFVAEYGPKAGTKSPTGSTTTTAATS